ncbi:hypothetical protein EV424DRAFT_722381 [Suillus variegatus]|nr:hypothetical protein EV424DRAFT_722381 [Suillus variegatus]
MGQLFFFSCTIRLLDYVIGMKYCARCLRNITNTLKGGTYIPTVYNHQRIPLDRKLSHRQRCCGWYLPMLVWQPKVAHRQGMGCHSPNVKHRALEHVADGMSNRPFPRAQGPSQEDILQMVKVNESDAEVLLENAPYLPERLLAVDCQESIQLQ